MRYRTTVTSKEDGQVGSFEYVWVDGKLISIVFVSDGSTQTAKYLYNDFDEPIGMVVTDDDGTLTTYYYLKNAQGDITNIVSASGGKLVEFTYDVFGNQTVHYQADPSTIIGMMNLAEQVVVRALTPFGYRGYCYDTYSGLYYLQSRYYDPQTGRFINADDTNYLNATGTVLGCNLFAYCENDPVNRVDETGEFGTPIQWACAVIGGLLGIPFGKWLANRLGYYGGWKYYAIRAAAIVGGAALGWFAGSYLIKLVRNYLIKHPETFLKISAKYGSQALIRFKNIFGLYTINKNAFSSWLYYKLINKATSSAAIGRLFEKWYYYYYNVSSKSQQISTKINGVKVRLDAIVNGRIIELKNYNWSIYNSYDKIINNFVNQANKYKQLIGKTVNGQTIKGVTFYFSSKPPQVIIDALKAIGVKVQWVK